MSSDSKQTREPNARLWLAVYTQPRWEKKVHRLLEERGLESYCPLNKVYRQWSDRVKKVEEPLFKSYVFVHVTEAERTAVRMTPGVLNFVYWLGKPAVIRAEEISEIRRFLNEYENVEVERLDTPIAEGDKVVITSGLMMDQPATVLRAGNRTVEVLIESIGFRLVAKVERRKLKKI